MRATTEERWSCWREAFSAAGARRRRDGECVLPRLCDFQAALPLAQRGVVLEQQLAGPRSLGHAQVLQELCMVQSGLKDFVAASKAIKEALAIREQLGLQRHEQYGPMLVTLARLDHAQRRYKEALTIYNMAKAVLAQYKEGNEYGTLPTTWPFATNVCTDGTRLSPATRRQLSTAATCTAPTIPSTRPR
jgi:hypothetical protein